MSERINDHLPKSKKYSPKQRLWYIRAKEVVISSGSIERPLVFGNNDTPGVILSSAAKEYLKVYGVLVVETHLYLQIMTVHTKLLLSLKKMESGP